MFHVDVTVPFSPYEEWRRGFLSTSFSGNAPDYVVTAETDDSVSLMFDTRQDGEESFYIFMDADSEWNDPLFPGQIRIDLQGSRLLYIVPFGTFDFGAAPWVIGEHGQIELPEFVQLDRTSTDI